MPGLILEPAATLFVQRSSWPQCSVGLHCIQSIVANLSSIHLMVLSSWTGTVRTVLPVCPCRALCSAAGGIAASVILVFCHNKPCPGQGRLAANNRPGLPKSCCLHHSPALHLEPMLKQMQSIGLKSSCQMLCKINYPALQASGVLQSAWLTCARALLV